MTAQRADLPNYAPEVRRALVDVPALCEALGLERSKSERAKYVCPRHGGGSLSVRVARDRSIQVRCFGCDLAGDVFTLIAEARGWNPRTDFREILIEGARIAGLWAIVGELEGRGATTPAKPKPIAAPKPPPVPDEPPPLDSDTFDAIVAKLTELAPLTKQSDVCSYLGERGLLSLASRAGWFALPPARDQGRVLSALTERFGMETLERSRLVKGGRIVWSDHRLCIPWRSPGVSGIVCTLQRRIIRAPRDGSEPKYVFPAGARPRYPYVNVEDLEELGADTAIAYVEGAVDALALGAICRRDGADVLVLGVPGVKNWRREWADLARGRVACIALDADAAGEDAVNEMLRDLANASSVRRWRPETGKDWAEHWAKSQGVAT